MNTGELQAHRETIAAALSALQAHEAGNDAQQATAGVFDDMAAHRLMLRRDVETALRSRLSEAVASVRHLLGAESGRLASVTRDEVAASLRPHCQNDAEALHSAEATPAVQALLRDEFAWMEGANFGEHDAQEALAFLNAHIGQAATK